MAWFLAAVLSPMIVFGPAYIASTIMGHEERRDAALSGHGWDLTSTSEHTGLLLFNSTELPGNSVDDLQGLTINVTSIDVALFETKGFSVAGNVTVDNDGVQGGLMHGDFSFTVPGQKDNTQGSFVTINERYADDKTRAKFEALFTMIENTAALGVSEFVEIISIFEEARQKQDGSDGTFTHAGDDQVAEWDSYAGSRREECGYSTLFADCTPS